MLKITNNKLNNFFENNTIITVKEAEKIGIKRQILSNLCKKGILERVKQGVYQKNDTITDEFVKIQKNNNVIFSNTTALYFHNLTDRVPNTISITVSQGYNVLHITKKFENLKIHYVKKEIFESGKIETLSKMGAKIYIYDKERTICDIIKNKEKRWWNYGRPIYNFKKIKRKKRTYSTRISFSFRSRARNYWRY
nr:MAG TPA: putative transcriptional regulator [Caudoviricetes sp.]